MVYKDLFLLENYLRSNEATYLHLDLACEMSLAEGVEKPINSAFEDAKVNGMIIVIYAESEMERKMMFKDIMKLGTIQFTSEVFSYTSVYNNELIVINANESKW